MRLGTICRPLRGRGGATDAYGLARAWYECARPPHACAPCSQAHIPQTTAVAVVADQGPEAEHVVVQPVECHRDRRRSIDFPADPTDPPRLPLVRGEVARA